VNAGSVAAHSMQRVRPKASPSPRNTPSRGVGSGRSARPVIVKVNVNLHLHLQMLLRPVPQKFNTFSTFNTFITFDGVAANHCIEPAAVAMSRRSERAPSRTITRCTANASVQKTTGASRGRLRSAQ
jgi:hypothetical protein